MTDPLSTADERQLWEWAFGREGVVTDRELAEAALRELSRRGELKQAEAARLEAEQSDEAERASAEQAEAARAAEGSGDGETAREHPPLTEDERRHRRRMLATGWAGVAAAALALLVGLPVLAQPDPDPLAVFERPATERDVEWEARLVSSGIAAVTLGPRVVELEGGLLAVAFRAAAVGDGTSTEWDPYCVVLSDPEATTELAWALGGNCVSPEQFARRGLVAPLFPSEEVSGLDAVVWGLIGPPRLERGVDYEQAAFIGESAIDRLVYPDSDTSIVDDPSRLLAGPSAILGGNSADGGYVLASIHLLSSDDPDAEPTFCVHVAANDSTSSTACTALSAVRATGIDVPVSAGGNTWNVIIAPDGPDRQDILEFAN